MSTFKFDGMNCITSKLKEVLCILTFIFLKKKFQLKNILLKFFPNKKKKKSFNHSFPSLIFPFYSFLDFFHCFLVNFHLPKWQKETNVVVSMTANSHFIQNPMLPSLLMSHFERGLLNPNA